MNDFKFILFKCKLIRILSFCYKMSKIFFLTLFFPGLIFGQIEPPDGLRENPSRVWAFEGGKIYVEPGEVKENATIIIRDGLIEKVGTNIKIPKDASVLVHETA